MKKLFYPLLALSLLLILGSPQSGQAQGTWYQVTNWTNTTTTQTLSNTTVTITSTGGNFNVPYNFCNNIPGPYLIGHFSAGNYLFQFSIPCSKIRIRVHGMQSGEKMWVEINNNTYNLGAANNLVQCTACSPGCQDNVASFVNGEMVAGVGTTGGEFIIDNAGAINSIKLLHNGMASGAGISLEFQEGVPAEADNNGPVCWGDTLKLFGEPTLPGGTYSWTGPNNFTSNQQNPVIPNPTAANGGDYILTVNGQSSDTTTVVMKPRPSVPAISFDPPVCAGDNLHISASSTPSGANFHWSGPNGFTGNGGNIDIPNAQSTNSGEYLVYADLNGCRSDTSTVMIDVKEPSHSQFSEIICSGETYTFKGKDFDQTGTYIDTLTNSQGCDSLVVLSLTVRPPLNLSISYDKTHNMCLGDTIHLTGHGAKEYTWQTKDKDLGEGETVTADLYDPKSVYFLNGVDKHGCKGKTKTIIQAKECCQVLVPNAFSPNGDGINDHFGIITNGHMNHFDLRVFNRYGQLIFHTFNPNNKWDGKINGEPADIGTYFYYITGKCYSGEKFQKKGNLTLLK